MNQPPLVLECPECGEQYLLSRNSQLFPEKTRLYSDGYFMDSEIWRTPDVIGCVTCELGFFPENGKLIAEPTWDEFFEKWAHLKKAEPPTAGSLVLELRARKNMSREQELKLRKELWYASNHTETGRLLTSKNKKFKAFCDDSLLKLDNLLVTVFLDQVLIKAEIQRQLGNFEVCISLLSKMEPSDVRDAILNKAYENKAQLFVVSGPPC